MATIRYAYASIGEKGKACGGKKGDQTGRELKLSVPYNFGQTYRWRFKSRLKARKAQKIILFIIQSRQCGYNQTERVTLYSLGAKSEWNFKKFKKLLKKEKVNTDCSALISVVINLTFGKKVVPCFTTATMTDCYNRFATLKKSFVFEHNSRVPFYTGYVGDILYRPNRHTVMVVKI